MTEIHLVQKLVVHSGFVQERENTTRLHKKKKHYTKSSPIYHELAEQSNISLN